MHFTPVHATSGEPATEPVTSSEVKSWSRIDTSADDTLIGTMITGARKRFETDTRRSLITQTWELYLDRFPCSDKECILLPRPPIISVSSITYTDTDGDSQTWSSSEYTLDAKSEPGRIYPAYGYSWPSTRDIPNAVKVTYTAGYGAASAVPQDIKDAILMLIGHRYEHREAVIVGAAPAEVPNGYERIVHSYAVFYDSATG